MRADQDFPEYITLRERSVQLSHQFRLVYYSIIRLLHRSITRSFSSHQFDLSKFSVPKCGEHRRTENKNLSTSDQ